MTIFECPPHFSHDIIDGSFFAFGLDSSTTGASTANDSTTGSDGSDGSLTDGSASSEGISTGSSGSSGTTLILLFSIYFSIAKIFVYKLSMEFSTFLFVS